MHWLELIVDVAGSDAEAVSELLYACGATAITYHADSDTPLLEPAPGTTPLWDSVSLVALFETSTDRSSVERGLASVFDDEAISNLRWQHLESRDWSREWLKDYSPMLFGNRLWVAPTGMAPPDPHAPAIVLDPGLAFGTGTHETTALCLEWIAQRNWGGERLMDYGCGSGILAIAALRLGAATAVALDIDPQALTATHNNASANSLQHRVETIEAARPGECFDVVLANILAGPLITLAPQLTALVKPGGDLVMSGVLAAQVAGLCDVYENAFKLDAPAHRGDWALLSGRRRQ